MSILNLFMDRDGTLIRDCHYLRDPDRVELEPGAGQALARLAETGVRFFLVTNQSGIGRGLLLPGDYEACQARLAELLNGFGVRLEQSVFCPHAPDEGCGCRKPALGLWRGLRDRHGLDPARCAMVGDKASDVAFGLDAGFALSLLVLTGHGEDQARRLGLPNLEGDAAELSDRLPGWPHAQARDLASALAWMEGKGAFRG